MAKTSSCPQHLFFPISFRNTALNFSRAYGFPEKGIFPKLPVVMMKFCHGDGSYVQLLGTVLKQGSWWS